MRLWIDGVWIDGGLRIDQWRDMASSRYDTTLNLSGGSHSIKMEYYENGGGAVAKLWWDQSSGGGTTTRSTVIVDDNGSGFQLLGPSQYWHVAAIGYNNRMYWTWNETSTVSNFARWTPNLTGGNYEVFVVVPYDNATTRNARYIIHYAGGTAQRTVNQSAYFNTWVSLGTYNFQGGTQGFVELADVTGEARGATKVGIDALKFEPR